MKQGKLKKAAEQIKEAEERKKQADAEEKEAEERNTTQRRIERCRKKAEARCRWALLTSMAVRYAQQTASREAEEAQQREQKEAAHRHLEEEKEEQHAVAEQQRRVQLAEQVEAMAQLDREMAAMDAAEAKATTAETAAVEAEQQGGGGESKDGGNGGGGAARDIECVVCMDEPTSCLFLPCRHMCVCRVCADLIMASATADCPKCRTKVEYIIDVFV